MIQLFFASSGIMFFFLRIFLGFFFLRTIQKEFPARKNIFQKILFIGLIIFSIALLCGAFTQLIALFALFFVSILYYKKIKLVSRELTFIFPFLIFSLGILVSVGGGNWSVDNFFGIILY